MRWKIVGLGIGVALLASTQARADDAVSSCPVAQGQSCWEARAACEQRKAEAAAAKAAALELQLKNQPPMIEDTMLFKTDSAQPVEQRELSAVATKVKGTPGAHVRLEGYTDDRGTENYNHALSLRRAEAVKAQLVEQGVDKDQIDTVPLGEVAPVSDNTSVEGRALNRRVDIIVNTAPGASSVNTSSTMPSAPVSPTVPSEAVPPPESPNPPPFIP